MDKHVDRTMLKGAKLVEGLHEIVTKLVPC